ncbi:MAG: flagellar filament capping protein FliD [Granulosicoccus sp.]
MALTAAGVGSGIDIESILRQLGEIERRPVEVLNRKREALDVELSAFGRVKSALSEFQTAAKNLGSNSDFGAFVATSSDETVFTATAVNGEAAVNHEVEVLALATNHRLASGPYASADSAVESGTLTFSSAEESFDIVVDETNNTLSGLRDAINAMPSNSSMSASIINVDGGSRLVLTAKESGSEGMIDVVRNSALPFGDDSAGFEEITEATDASLIVHGFQVTRSSNTINDVIGGVTLDLTGVGKSTVDSRRDLTSLKTAADEFVTSYNSMSTALTSISQTDLRGDQLPRGVEQRIRSMFFDSVDLGDGDSASALDMGFSFDRFGKLNLDSTRYEAALDQGVNRYVEAFAKPETGLSSLFSSLIDEYTQAGGVIDGREDGVDTRKSSIDTQIERLEYRLEKTNDRLRRQFTAMDLAVTNLQQTSGFLNSRLGQNNF